MKYTIPGLVQKLKAEHPELGREKQTLRIWWHKGVFKECDTISGKPIFDDAAYEKIVAHSHETKKSNHTKKYWAEIRQSLAKTRGESL